jgi:4-diphosphocytidyl-2-C-methyl-D-erythritol kinase
MRLRALAPAKVNLSLFVGPTRPDGRHELVTLFQSLSLCDELELETRPSPPDRVQCAEVPGDTNLAAAALAELRARGWAGPPVTIRITKRIPVAAGLAGGSADAAATLRLASELAPGRPEEVEAVAAGLGADVPAQLAPGLAIGTGAGETVERLEPLARHALVVVPLPAELSTPAVYREADRLGLPRDLTELAERLTQLRLAVRPGARLPGELMINDLEPAAVSLCPAVGEALDHVRATGAEMAMVSGSGPTVVGIWWGEDAETAAERAARSLLSNHPRAQVAAPVDANVGVPEAV